MTEDELNSLLKHLRDNTVWAASRPITGEVLVFVNKSNNITEQIHTAFRDLQAENAKLKDYFKASTELCNIREEQLRGEIAEVGKLREELEEIRDLARTGLPPADMYPTEEDWLRHKCNRIAYLAQAALA